MVQGLIATKREPGCRRPPICSRGAFGEGLTWLCSFVSPGPVPLAQRQSVRIRRAASKVQPPLPLSRRAATALRGGPYQCSEAGLRKRHSPPQFPSRRQAGEPAARGRPAPGRRPPGYRGKPRHGHYDPCSTGCTSGCGGQLYGACERVVGLGVRTGSGPAEKFSVTGTKTESNRPPRSATAAARHS